MVGTPRRRVSRDRSSFSFLSTLSPAPPPDFLDITWQAFWHPATPLGTYGDAGAVVTWVDDTGNGWSPTQGTSGARPVCDADGINGNPAVAYVTSDQLSIGSLTLAQPFSLVLTVLPSMADATQRYIGFNTDSGARCVGQSATGSGAFSMNAGSLVEGGSPTTNPTVLRYYIAGAASTCHVDGTLTFSGNAGALGINQIILGTTSFVGLLGPCAVYAGQIADDPLWPSVGPLFSSYANTAGA